MFNQNSNLRKDWIRAIKRENASGKDRKPNADSRVCSIHFSVQPIKENLFVPNLLLGYN